MSTEVQTLNQHAPLDYVVFKLTTTRTRCEVLASAGETTEKLATGLARPFIAHIQAVEDQIANGSHFVELVPSRNASGSTSVGVPQSFFWFTKGTIEKVIRFVNSPQLLERIIAIDVELKELEESQPESLSDAASDHQAKSDTGHSYPHMRSPGRSPVRSSSPARSPSPVSRTPKKASNEDLPEESHDSSRRRWSAIEARKSMLRRELNVALARANAAGFLEDEMPSVQTFAEFFGAARLRDACIKYCMVLKRKTSAQSQKIRSSSSKSRRLDLDDSGSVRSDPGPSVLNPMPTSNVATRFPVYPAARHVTIPSPSVRSIHSEPGSMIKAKSYPETYASSEASSGFERDFSMDSAMMRYSSAPDVHSMEESQSISGGESMGENSDSVEAVQRSIGSGRGSASASSSGVSSEASDSADLLNSRSRPEEFISATSQPQLNEGFVQSKTGTDPKQFLSSSDRPWEKNPKAIVPYVNKPETPPSPSHYSARRASDVSSFRESLDVDLLVCPDSPLPRRSSWHSTTAPSSTLLDKSDTSSVVSFGSLRKDVRKSRVETNPVGVGRGSGNPAGTLRGSRSPEISPRIDSGDVTPVLGSRKDSPPSRRKESSDWLPSVMKSMTPFLEGRQSPSLVSSRPQSPSPSYKEIPFSPKSPASSERDSSDKSSQNGIRRSMSQDTGINLVKQSFVGTKSFPSNSNLSSFPLSHSYLTNSIPKSPSFPSIRSSMESLSPNDGSKSLSDSKIQGVDRKSFVQDQTKTKEDGSLSGFYHRKFDSPDVQTPERPPTTESPNSLKKDHNESSAVPPVESSLSKIQEKSQADSSIDVESIPDIPSESKVVELTSHSETVSSSLSPTSQPVAEVSSQPSNPLAPSSSTNPPSPLSNPPAEDPSTSGTEATKPTEPSTTSSYSPLDPTSNSPSGHPASSSSPGHLDMRYPLTQPPDPLVPGWGLPLTSLQNSSSVYPTPGQFIPPHTAGFVLPGGSPFLHAYPFPSPDSPMAPGHNQMYYWPFMGNSVLPPEPRAPASPAPGDIANHPYLPSWASRKSHSEDKSEDHSQSIPNKKSGTSSDSGKMITSKEESEEELEDGKEEKNSKRKGSKQFPVKKKSVTPVRRVVLIKNIQYVPEPSVQAPPSGEKHAPLQTEMNVPPQSEILPVESKPAFSAPDPYEPSVEEFMMLNSKEAWSYRERRSHLGEEDLRGIDMNFEPVNPRESAPLSLPPELYPVSSMEKKERRTELKEEDFRGVIEESESSKLSKSQNTTSYDPMVNFISWATSDRTKSPAYSIQEADLRGSDPTLDSNEPETMRDVKSPATRNPPTSIGSKTKPGGVNGRRTSTIPPSRSRPSPFDTGRDTVTEAQLRAQERLKQRKSDASKKQEEEKRKLEDARARRRNRAADVDSMDITSRLTRPTASSLQQSIVHGSQSTPSKTTASSASNYSRRASMGGEAIARKGPSPVRPSAWGSSSRF